MNIQQKLHDALTAITALGTRVHPGGKVPNNPTYPLAVTQFISNQPATGYIASSRRTDFDPQITIMSRDYAELVTLRTAVIAACEAMPEMVERKLDFDAGFDFNINTYSHILQFQFRDVEQ